MITLSLAIDGHYPRLNPSATHFVCGAAVVSCYKLDGTLVYSAIGRSPKFINNDEFVYILDHSSVAADILKYNIKTRELTKLPLQPAYAAFNYFDGNNGTWAGIRQAHRLLIINGEIIASNCEGVAVNGEFTVTVSNNEFKRFRGKELHGSYPRPQGSNKFNVNEIGEIFYGYNHDSNVIRLDGKIDDITITPWRAESPAQEVNGWYWISTESPELEHLICGRPKNDTNCLIQEDIPAADFDVKFKDKKFYIVAADAKGRITLVVLDSEAPRIPLQDKEDIIVDQPGVTIDNYDKVLTSTNNWELNWKDRNNPGFSGKVEFINGSVHVSYTNPSGTDRSGMERKVKIGDSVIIPPPPITGQRRGNFLCIPGFEWAFMYPGWDVDKQRAYRAKLRELGYNWTPMGIWGKYKASGSPEFDYSRDPIGYRRILSELKEEGIEPIVFCVTDAVNEQTKITPSNVNEFLDYFLPNIFDLVNLACTGWELNQVEGWSEKEGNFNSGHDIIKLSERMRQHLPDAEIMTHYQPNWWAPHYSAGKEWKWWTDAKEINSLLFQIRPESSISLSGDPSKPDGMYLALKYPIGSIEGIAGRMVALGKKFYMFEHSREISRFNQVVAIVNNDSRVKGYC